MNDDEKNIPESNNSCQETDKARDINFEKYILDTPNLI